MEKTLKLIWKCTYIECMWMNQFFCIFAHPFPHSIKSLLNSKVSRCRVWMTHLQDPQLFFFTLYYSNFFLVFIPVHHFYSPHYHSVRSLPNESLHVFVPSFRYWYWLPLLPAITYFMASSRISSSRTLSTLFFSLISASQSVFFEETTIAPYIVVTPVHF